MEDPYRAGTDIAIAMVDEGVRKGKAFGYSNMVHLLLNEAGSLTLNR